MYLKLNNHKGGNVYGHRKEQRRKVSKEGRK